MIVPALGPGICFLTNDIAHWPIIATPTIIAYIEAILAVYDAAEADGKMEVVMTQKWISSFGNAIDQYTDYRRTGFPVMANPSIDGNPLTDSSRDYPLSMPWADNDLTLNSNAPDQKLIATSGVFWDINN